MKKALIIPDCHIPAEDKKAYNLMLEVATSDQIDEIVILGDFADFYGVNSHGKDPRIDVKLAREIDQVNERLDELQMLFPEAGIQYAEGNHEYRLERYLMREAPEIFELVELKKLLKIEERGIKWHEYGPTQLGQVLGSNLYFRHEPLGGSEHVAADSVKKAGASIIFGHTHRIQEHQIVDINGNYHRGISAGWMGNKHHKSMNYVKSHHQWAMGFAVVTVLPSKDFFVDMKHIINYKVLHNGKIYG